MPKDQREPILQVAALEDLIYKLKIQAESMRDIRNTKLKGVVDAIAHAAPLLLTSLELASVQLEFKKQPTLFQ